MGKPPFVPVIIGTGFGSGFWPWGPGTAGALLATIIWWALSAIMGEACLILVTALLIIIFTALGTWAAHRLSPYWGEDPRRVVVDEMVGVWIPLLVSPAGDVWYAATSFVLFRLFDIIKPFGIRSIDRKKGAFYVMLDDIVAGIYSLVLIVFYRWVV